MAPAAAIVVAILLGLIAYTIASTPGSVTSPIPTRFTVNGSSFAITDAATNNAQREQGLMNTKVANTTIMIFAFPSAGYQRFWMYGTNTSLDIIWVSADGSHGRVVYVVNSAQPCHDSSACTTYAPDAPANYVLETKAGFAQTNGVEVGTYIEFG